jgi:HTH-type transcriptional regulator, competence development regulator
MSELTHLGKFLRKLRIDRGELLRTMATHLGVSMSFLSSVENGKKGMPSEWVAKIPDLYKLTDAQKQEFDAAVAESEKGIGVKFAGLSEENKKLSVAFARKINTLSEEDRKLLQDLLF